MKPFSTNRYKRVFFEHYNTTDKDTDVQEALMEPPCVLSIPNSLRTLIFRDLLPKKNVETVQYTSAAVYKDRNCNFLRSGSSQNLPSTEDSLALPLPTAGTN